MPRTTPLPQNQPVPERAPRPPSEFLTLLHDPIATSRPSSTSMTASAARHTSTPNSKPRLARPRWQVRARPPDAQMHVLDLLAREVDARIKFGMTKRRSSMSTSALGGLAQRNRKPLRAHHPQHSRAATLAPGYGGACLGRLEGRRSALEPKACLAMPGSPLPGCRGAAERQRLLPSAAFAVRSSVPSPGRRQLDTSSDQRPLPFARALLFRLNLGSSDNRPVERPLIRTSGRAPAALPHGRRAPEH